MSQLERDWLHEHVWETYPSWLGGSVVFDGFTREWVLVHHCKHPDCKARLEWRNWEHGAGQRVVLIEHDGARSQIPPPPEEEGHDRDQPDQQDRLVHPS